MEGIRRKFKDPIYDLIYLNVEDLEQLFPNENERKEISNVIRKITISEPFVRMGRISQLGTTSDIFPSATGSRFSHSLGVFQLAKLALRNKELSWTKKEAIILIFAALIHDIGHCALSHSFELFVDPDKNYTHEELTIKIVSDRKSEIYKLFKESEIEEIQKLPRTLKKVFNVAIKLEDLNSSFKKIRGVLTSQVDIDRLDYLSRDPYHLGVDITFNESRFLLDAIRWDKKEQKFYFKRKSENLLARYLWTRFQLHTAIYSHPHCVYKDSIIYFIGQEIRAKGGFDELLQKASSDPRNIKLEDFLEITDDWFWQKMRELEKGDNETIVKLVKRLKSHNFDFEGFSTEKEFLNTLDGNLLTTIKDKLEDGEDRSFINIDGRTIFWYKVHNKKVYDPTNPIYFKDFDKLNPFKEENLIQSSLEVKVNYIVWEM